MLPTILVALGALVVATVAGALLAPARQAGEGWHDVRTDPLATNGFDCSGTVPTR